MAVVRNALFASSVLRQYSGYDCAFPGRQRPPNRRMLARLLTATWHTPKGRFSEQHAGCAVASQGVFGSDGAANAIKVLMIHRKRGGCRTRSSKPPPSGLTRRDTSPTMGKPPCTCLPILTTLSRNPLHARTSCQHTTRKTVATGGMGNTGCYWGRMATMWTACAQCGTAWICETCAALTCKTWAWACVLALQLGTPTVLPAGPEAWAS